MRPEEAHPFREKVKLKRTLSLFDATVYGVGVILGAGIYALIGEVSGVSGNLSWMSFVVAAIFAGVTALSYAELSSMFPKCSAEYTYLKEAFKSKPLGFIAGYSSLLVIIIAAAAVSLGFAGYFQALTGFPFVLSAIGVLGLFSIINFVGIRESANLNIFMTLIEVGGLLLIILLGFQFIGAVDYFAGPVATTNLFDYFSPVVLGAALIFFAFIGFEDVANISEETKNASKIIPKALLLALIISTIIYILVSIVAVSAVPFEELAASKAPLSLVAEKAAGSWVGGLLGIVALFSTANTILILLIVGSRVSYGMARDGSLPKFLSKLHSKTQTPYWSIIILFLISVGFALFADLGTVASLTNIAIYFMFLLVNISVIVLRFREPKLARPFKIPLSIGKLPVFPAISAIFCLFMMFQFTEPITFFGVTLPLVLFGLLALATSIPVYFILNFNKRRLIETGRQ